MTNDMNWAPLHPLRQQIDMVDDKIMALFGERYRLRDQMHRAKEAHGLPLRDPAREADVMRHATENARIYGVSPEFATALYTLVLEHAHQYEQHYLNQKVKG